MSKSKPKKRVFKAWAVMRSNGEIEKTIFDKPMLLETRKEAKWWIVIKRYADRNSKPKRVTIIVED